MAGARRGLKIVVLDKGRDIEARRCFQKQEHRQCVGCAPCSTLCGWGGAGAFSDGKMTLSTEVGGHLAEYIGKEPLQALLDYVDGIYLRFGAPERVYGLDREVEIEEIRKKAVLADLKLVPAPIRHLGTGRCGQIMQKMREELAAAGVVVRTGTPVAELIVRDGGIAGVRTTAGEMIAGRFVVVCPGREGAEWLKEEAVRLGLTMAINPVDLGVRVELPAPVMAHLTDVVYESKFIYHSRSFDDRVRTFCMNPYGEVVMENNEGLITVNGHTHAEKKTANTNFALLVSKNFTEPFKEPIAYGKYVARLANLLGGGVIVQRLGDLIAGQRSTPDRIRKGLVTPTLPEATPGDLSLVLPYRFLKDVVEMLKAMDAIAPGVFSRNTLLYGVEVKFYSSRLQLKPDMEAEIENLFAVGDGAGVTRGLMQASAAGVLAARTILGRV
ncbi:MAG: FAD-dependent oxidoreductase [Heliobacteriaceae bacterium]|nr:FAD-dependent oxidoreductase [Heliobacteriaceae bacterium]